jgi:hypothetical protein
MTQPQETTPTVALTDLVHDRCNFQDREFEAFVDRFMEKWMPGFPLQLLERDYDRWEIEPDYTYTVESELPPDCDDMHETFFVMDREGERHEFAEESDAEEFCDEQREEDEQSGLGFPWAWNWCHYPADNIHDDDLRAAGFTVAQYSTSDGDQYRVCGIDGCGYSFHGSHYASLCAIVCIRWGRAVDTDNGPAYLTLGRMMNGEQST